MCGIIGIIGNAPVAPFLVQALKRLEYRGYDSAGVATLVNGHIERRRAEGKLVNLEALLESEPLPGLIGIGHTRWATHGKPSVRNAHPIITDRVAVVHNGIIENFIELKDELIKKKFEFKSDTDTEVVAQLLTSYLESQMSPQQAMQKAMIVLKGAFSLVVMFSGRHDILLGAVHGSSLAVGYGESAMYLGTDALGLGPFTKRVSYLEDGDIAQLTTDTCEVSDQDGKPVVREVQISKFGQVDVSKGGYPHHTLKEIHEQPAVVGDTIQAFISPDKTVRMNASFDWNDITGISMTACGTAFYSCMVAEYWFEALAGIPVKTEIASQLHSRKRPLPQGGLFIAVSQSGATADTLAAFRYAKANRQTLMSVVNVPESIIARESQNNYPTLAGPEIGVASTKALSTQMITLLCIAIYAGRRRGVISLQQEQEYVSALLQAPSMFSEMISKEAVCKNAAISLLAKHRSAFYLGRDNMFPLALEGALKLKELSYIHAEGYAGGELKHGPIALITKSTPVVILAPSGDSFAETRSNFEQIHSRSAPILLISDKKGCELLGPQAKISFEVPDAHPLIVPILYTVPMQLLSYYAAVALNRDVDQPRNLAKSVTVK